MLVALTGFGQQQDKEKATRAGFDAHLTKPASEAALTGILAWRAWGGSYEKETEPLTSPN
jgi:CheY-like chemotaxis protein